jgi:hypothetical protein
MFWPSAMAIAASGVAIGLAVRRAVITRKLRSHPSRHAGLAHARA